MINNEILKYHEFVTDTILSGIKKPERKFKNHQMQELSFYDRYIEDVEGYEWCFTGCYRCDLDSEGNWNDDELIELFLSVEMPDDKFGRNIFMMLPKNESELIGRFKKEDIEKFKEELRTELYNDLIRGIL